MTKFTAPFNIGQFDSDTTAASIDASGTATFAQVNVPTNTVTGTETVNTLRVSANSVMDGTLAVSGATTLAGVTLSTVLATQIQVVTAAVTASAETGGTSPVPATAAGYIVVEVCGAHHAIPYFNFT